MERPVRSLLGSRPCRVRCERHSFRHGVLDNSCLQQGHVRNEDGHGHLGFRHQTGGDRSLRRGQRAGFRSSRHRQRSLCRNLHPRPGQSSVTSYAPTSGPPGTVVVLSGSGFASAKTDNVVRFAGGRIAEVVERTDTALTVKVPRGAKAGRITVETPDGQQTAPDYFDVPLEGNEFETTVGTSPTDETPPSVTISASDKRARVLVDADAGDSLTFHLSGSTFQGDLRLRMVSPPRCRAS
ncbi:IPT/TIG domain-containing protein [Streptomyces anulatus]|nr:IPT/TIG domain-containing protein [Streptomyces anulatus]WSW88264.1 IPT/TIG domain-containing protein [Streptomyces anulatus]